MGGRKANSRGPGGRGPRRLAVGLAIAALLLGGQPARAEGFAEAVGDIVAIPYDLVILRPLGAVALVLGTGAFTLSAPFVYPFEGLETSWDVFVYAPFEYTFLREIGSF